MGEYAVFEECDNDNDQFNITSAIWTGACVPDVMFEKHMYIDSNCDRAAEIETLPIAFDVCMKGYYVKPDEPQLYYMARCERDDTIQFAIYNQSDCSGDSMYDYESTIGECEPINDQFMKPEWNDNCRSRNQKLKAINDWESKFAKKKNEVNVNDRESVLFTRYMYAHDKPHCDTDPTNTTINVFTLNECQDRTSLVCYSPGILQWVTYDNDECAGNATETADVVYDECDSENSEYGVTKAIWNGACVPDILFDKHMYIDSFCSRSAGTETLPIKFGFCTKGYYVTADHQQLYSIAKCIGNNTIHFDIYDTSDCNSVPLYPYTATVDQCEPINDQYMKPDWTGLCRDAANNVGRRKPQRILFN